jgi:hypothetical protein
MAKAKSNFSFDVIKKNLFWFFVPLAILLVWGIFFVAISKTKAALAARIAGLDGVKTATEGIASNNKHPNQATIDNAKQKELEIRDTVYKAWEVMYQVQKENCTWSNELDARFVAYVSDRKWMSPIPNLNWRDWYNTFIARQIPEFLVKAERRAVYVKVPDPNSTKNPKEWMKNPDGSDRFYPIDPYVADPDAMLLQNAQAISTASGMGGMSGGAMGGGGSMGGGAGGGGFTSFSTTAGSAMGGGGMGGGAMGGGMSGDGGMGNLSNSAQNLGTTLDSIFLPANQKVEGIVDWPTPEIFTIVTWPGQTPFSGQIWYAQEEVWVYESLINVVRNINRQVSATGPHNAAIKRIQAMLIGKNAAPIVRSPGILEPLGSASGAMMMGDGMDMSMTSGSGSSGSMMPSDMMGEGGMMASGPMNEEDTMAFLKKFRYVGEDLKPLSDTDPAPFTEFNMMPVCLELIVDQRKIPDILVECANSTMPIDIKLVRYNPANARTGLISSPMGGAGMDSMMSDMGGGGMSGSMSGGAGGPLGGRGATAGMEAAADQLSGFEVGGKIGVYGSDAVMIQIVGIIYIYNEPDPKRFATGAGAQESGIEGGVIPEEPSQNDATVLTPDNSVVSTDATTVVNE